MYSKEEFNKVWKDSTKKSILNQFYYEHEDLQKYIKVLDKIKELVNKALVPNSDYVEYEYGTELLRQEFLELLEEIE